MCILTVVVWGLLLEKLPYIFTMVLLMMLRMQSCMPIEVVYMMGSLFSILVVMLFKRCMPVTFVLGIPALLL